MSSNVVLIKKNDNKPRFCVDYRRLDEKTIKDAYPLPRISACLDALGSAEYFSTFDLRSDYHQVLMEPVDTEKTAFVTREGFYEYRLMPFELSNATATFQRLMDITSDLNFLILLVYLDDIIIYSKTITEHLERLELLFRRLAAANLKLKSSKCFLLQKKVAFLGHTISAKVLGTEDNKIESVRHWPTPKSVKDIRGFLGFCSYYRRFMRSFASIASPLLALTHTNIRFS